MGNTIINNYLCNWLCDSVIRVSFQSFYPSLSFVWLVNFLSFYISSNAQNSYYKVLIANAATSALRLHQRLPRVTFTREFLSLLLLEDSCHYLFFSLIFLYVNPVLLIITPVVIFATLHTASYSLTLLDVSRGKWGVFLFELKLNWIDFSLSRLDYGTKLLVGS